jgi:large subunit ribosomal protein L3
MDKAIIGKKIGMTQIFDEAGRAIPVTVIEAGPCTVVQKKTTEKDGYNAIQMGFQTIPERKLTQPELGHQKKAGITEFKKVLKEFTLKDCSTYEVGAEIKADVFKAGEFVDVTGISKGHGYQGVVKRHGAGRTPMTHGGGPVHRHAGSMGVIDPAHIFKGKIGAGQMGNEQVTVMNLDIIKVDAEYNLIAVRGAIPGPKGGIVFVKSTAKTHVEKKAGAGISNNPQKASARVNPQKASARNK